MRFTADCPLLDPALVRAAADVYRTVPGLDYLSTGLPPSRFLAAGPPARLSRMSQSRTGTSSSYSDRQAAQARRCRRTLAAALGSIAPTMYAPISPRHSLHAWLISVLRLL